MGTDVAENPYRPAEASDAPGRLLGAAREEQNLSVAEAARQLKLSVQQVEALEAGEFHKLPGPVFVRGFIRNYARLLKLDPEQLATAVARSLPHEQPRPAAPPSQDIPFPPAAPRRWPMYAALAVAAVIVLALYEFYLSERATVATRSATAPPSPSAGGALEASAPQAAASVAPSSGAAEGEGLMESPAQSGALAAANEQGGAPAVAAKSAPGNDEVGPKAGERQVHMIFDQESWVQIRDSSGKAVFSQLNRKGTEKRVNARPPLAVVVGNAHGVRFMYDDQPVDLARHTNVDVARFNLE
ncbi:MAG TPA: RodZ domain-containing protein [Burkholderiales bacterium]|nr:RodZ domain-containing protein [Burkholderiales bacterium]